MKPKWIKQSIIMGILMFAGIMLVVVMSNWSTIRRKLGVGKPQVSEAQTDPETDGGQIGSDLSGFLQDDDFFNEAESVDEIKIETGKKVSIMLDTVGSTLRITVVDAYGKLIKDTQFTAVIEDHGSYSDGNSDGVIQVDNLPEGKYFVSLEPVDGYIIPSTKTMITIGSDIEYKAFSDVSYMVSRESDIDCEKEDTAHDQALDVADGTELTQADAFSVDGKIGISVSSHNRNIDWGSVADTEEVDYAFIRCGYRGADSGTLIRDAMFKTNMVGAIKENIPVGVYFFSQAINETEAIEEASMVLEECRLYMLDYPIFVVSGPTDGRSRNDNLSKEERTEIIKAFCETIVNSDYEVGVYASADWWEEELDALSLNAYHAWVAQYCENADYEGYYDFWQYTSKGSIEGIETRVGLSVAYDN